MSTLRSVGRSSLYLAMAMFVVWLVVVLTGANRLPLISFPIHLNEAQEFILFFGFAIALTIGALISEYIRDSGDASA